MIDSLGTTTRVANTVATTAGNVASTTHPIAVFITVPIIVAIVLAKWVYDVYNATCVYFLHFLKYSKLKVLKYRPTIVCCFMAYIVDLVIIMHRVFHKGQPASMSMVKEVVENFKKETCNQVHLEVRSFMARHETFGAVTKKDKVLNKMKELIYNYTTHQASKSS